MKNVICIDLTKFNNEKIVDLAKSLNIDSDAVLHNKKSGFAKIFIEKSTGKVIAFTTKKNKDIVQYTTYLGEVLLSMESTEVEKTPIEMNIDNILDKISKYGIDSLSVNEKKFLDENSN